MLVLTRKSNEKIRIGDDIVITVLRTKGKAVRLGIEAPNDMRVLRGEIAFDQSDAEEADCHTKNRVAHARIPREQVSQVIPQLVSSDGPLSGFVNSVASGME